MSVISAPLEEGQAFDTGPESVYAVQDYALSINKSVRVERASGADRRLACASKQPCGFFVQIYRQRKTAQKTYGKWYIASMDLAHSELCDARRHLTTRQIAELPAFLAAVHANPRASIESLVAQVMAGHGVSLEKNIRLVYRARELVRSGKAGARHNLLASPDAPLPPRDFVRRHSRDKKLLLAEAKKDKTSDRMAWTDSLIESLLAERIVKHGEQFLEAGDQAQHRELWGAIQKEFSERYDVAVTVTQLRAKFRYLHGQYTRVRAEEEAAEKDAGELVVVYPRCWDMLAEYFGEEPPHSMSSLDVDREETTVTEAASGQPERVLTSSLSTPSASTQSAEMQNQTALEQSDTSQTTSERSMHVQPAPVYSPAQTRLQRSLSPVRSDTAVKRQRVSPPNASVVQQESLTLAVYNPAPPVSSDLEERLAIMQNIQTEMARSMDGMRQVVTQSNEAILGLQEALTQSNQVNAALLDFLRRQPGT